MTFGNVIPIDAEVARQLARRQVAFRWLVAGLTALWLAILVPTLLFTSLPPPAPFVALAVLVVLAEHRFVLFGDETSMSASIIVIVASIFVFADTAPLAGPMLIASIGGIYIPHLRNRSISKIAFNGTAMSISAWFAAAATIASSSDGTPSWLVGPVVLTATLVYWTLNNVVVAGHQVTLCGERFLRSVRSLIGADTDALLWAGAGALATIATDNRTATAIAFVACVVSLRVATVSIGSQVRFSGGQSTSELRLIFWLSSVAVVTLPGTLSVEMVALCLSVVFLLGKRPSHPNPLMAVWLPLLPILLADCGLVALGCIGLATIALAARSGSAMSAWTYSITIGTTIAIASMDVWHPLLSGSVATALVYAAIAPVLAAAVFAILIARLVRPSDLWVTVGMVIPGGHDLVTTAVAAVLALGTSRAPLLTLSLVTASFAAASVLPRSRTREVR